MTQDEHIQKKKFEELFREHFTGLCYFAQKYLGDLDSSKEIVHSVFIKIWESRNDFDWEKPAKSYLFTSVYNRSMNFIRDNKKFVSSDDAETGNLTVESSEFTDSMEISELEGKIKESILKLPEKCREIFELNRFEGKKYSEIAEKLGISIKTVENQMSKALKVLRTDLKDYLYIFILILLKNKNLL
ncbi:MAG: RNA polymerase sigma-70 factor [Bacteroidales bacterium]|nr:RNA polymerase sigma-70 factor [Bacteroidales bacterium]MBN2819067.1 RNA polymerase sigma-70 factor [Bacteroidales bacterium]